MGIIKEPLKCGEIKCFDPCGNLKAVIGCASPRANCPYQHLACVTAHFQ